MPKLSLSVVVCSYKNPELLRTCLCSVQKSIREISSEIIVADSATEEDTAMMLREDFPHVRFFPNRENTGFGKLVNSGLRESLGEYILFLNQDVVLLEDTVLSMMEFLRKHHEIGIIGPRLLNFDGTPQDSAFRFYTPMTIVYRRTLLRKFSFARKHLKRFVYKDKDMHKAQCVDWIMGSALLVSREAACAVGEMDSRFFMYMEDVDWCRRFWNKGYNVVYYPHVSAYHYHGKGSERGGVFRSLFNRLTWVHIASACKYFKKYWGKPIPQYADTVYSK